MTARHLDTHLGAWQAEDADFSILPPASGKATAEIARRLAEAMPGRQNDMPTPVKKGTRCTVTYRGVTATGTIRFSYTAPEPIARVQLDGNETTEGPVVEVPWNLLGKEQR